MSISTCGLLLQEVPYLGKKKILKVFTPEQGLISLFAKNGSGFAPFALAEWVFQKKQKDLLPLLDASLIDPLLHLRESYTTLLAAGSIVQGIFRTQLPHKKAPKLFDLTLFYLKKLPISPLLLSASFRLKLLLHEGLLSNPDPAFTPSEWGAICTLAFSRSLAAMQKIESAPYAKINFLFDERIS